MPRLPGNEPVVDHELGGVPPWRTAVVRGFSALRSPRGRCRTERCKPQMKSPASPVSEAGLIMPPKNDVAGCE